MSVLIKGMEMPEAGAYVCELGVIDKNTAVLTLHTPIDDPQRSYKLVPVPPHGRLIDADETIEVQMFDEMYEEWTLKTMSVADYLAFAADMPPTIIEAEEGEPDVNFN